MKLLSCFGNLKTEKKNGVDILVFQILHINKKLMFEILEMGSNIQFCNEKVNHYTGQYKTKHDIIVAHLHSPYINISPDDDNYYKMYNDYTIEDEYYLRVSYTILLLCDYDDKKIIEVHKILQYLNSIKKIIMYLIKLKDNNKVNRLIIIQPDDIDYIKEVKSNTICNKVFSNIIKFIQQ